MRVTHFYQAKAFNLKCTVLHFSYLPALFLTSNRIVAFPIQAAHQSSPILFLSVPKSMRVSRILAAVVCYHGEEWRQVPMMIIVSQSYMLEQFAMTCSSTGSHVHWDWLPRQPPQQLETSLN